MTVAAYTYVWSGALAALEGKGWDPVEYMKGRGAEVTRSGRRLWGCVWGGRHRLLDLS